MALTKAKCREIFESVAGADGLLTPQELKTAIQNMSEAANLSSDDVDKIVAECFQGMDMDGDQKITLDEFVNDLTKSGRKQKLKETFEAWDKDGSGELSKDELKSAIAETMDEDTANEIVDQINDDKITLDDFLELCN
ncbi:hypothetical protein CHS0354_031522 [Potamilus streckersoni]|uniref:EF-hand domain-containing protein n=1 Tax=Potamilus streckersoni TaxID=2493646 RepID=A0AAE0SID4_9BIVA|nr:hypothetical protein CHS0354_031522 [Potamilus streckersoni]